MKKKAYRDGEAEAASDAYGGTIDKAGNCVR